MRARSAAAIAEAGALSELKHAGLLGSLRETVLRQLADSTNKKAGEFYTPRSVVRLMVDILDPKEGETIYDPACGTGGMLPAAVAHVRERVGPRAVGVRPMGPRVRGASNRQQRRHGWVQHMVKSMAARTGRMAVVLPQGALFRGGVEGQIRKHLLEHDLVEAVIGLAPNLFYGTGLAACVLVLRQKKATSRQGKVLVIDASTSSARAERRTSWRACTPSRSSPGRRDSRTSRIALAS